VLAVTATTTAHPAAAEPVQLAYAGVGRRPRPRYPHSAQTLKALAAQARADSADNTADNAADNAAAPRRVRWRQAAGSRPEKRAWMSGWFSAIRVRPAGRGVTSDHDGTYPEAWLLTQWPKQKATEPSD
jgi:hypothetical protein